MNGKVVKSATDKINNGNILYIVSAYLRDMVLSIEQIKVDDTSFIRFTRNKRSRLCT